MDRLPARLFSPPPPPPPPLPPLLPLSPPPFFLPVRVLSRLFRGLFLHYLDKAFTAGRLSFFSTLLPLKERPAFSQHLARVRKTECR